MTSSELSVLAQQRDKVQDEFINLMEDARFLQTVSGGTGDVEKVRRRFASIEGLFREVVR
jgi:hypothetical protein